MLIQPLFPEKFKFWLSWRYLMIHGICSLLKIKGRDADEFWTVIIPGAGLFISFNLHFLTFNEWFLFFSKIFLWFFFLCNCLEVSSSAVLGMTFKGPTHDHGPWQLHEGLLRKSLFHWTIKLRWKITGGWKWLHTMNEIVKLFQNIKLMEKWKFWFVNVSIHS